MPSGKPSDEPLRKVTFDAYAEDWEEFKRLHGPQERAAVLRALMRNHIKKVRNDD